LLIKYIKSVLWRVAKCLSYIEEARYLKVNHKYIKSVLWRVAKRLSYIQDARCLKVKMTLKNTTFRRQDRFLFLVRPDM